MKDFIYLNYNLKIKKIYSKYDKRYFFINNEKIYLYILNEEKYINELASITNKMYYNNIKVNTFIINNQGNYYTKKDNKYIVLLKTNDMLCDISLDYLVKFKGYNIDIKKIDLLECWKNEIDTLEKELTEYNKEYPLIQESFNYFVGISENGIELLLTLNNKTRDTCICHEIDHNFLKDWDLNNPLSFISANKTYDLSNYIKYKFYNNKLAFDEVETIIDSLNESDQIYLYSCLLYSNVYFEIVKNILRNKKSEEELKIIINSIKRYEQLLSYCKSKVKNITMIQIINWIE